MTAYEMLVFCRYFSVMIGDLIPVADEHWALYLHLRTILSLVTAKHIPLSWCDLLQYHIKEHHALFIKLFPTVTLKPKFHILLHYPEIIKKTGRPVLLWCMRYEAKHKILKSFAQACASRVNISATIAKKHQLQLCNKLVLNEGFKETVTVGYLLNYRKFDQDQNVNETLSYFNLSNNLKQYNFVVVFGTKYRINDFILTSTDEDMPSFGCIQLILVEESDVIFIYRKCVTVLFDEHYHSYLINNDVRMNGFGCINQEMLPYKSPVLCSIVVIKSFLTLKYTV
jgi:hypothetical protein